MAKRLRIASMIALVVLFTMLKSELTVRAEDYYNVDYSNIFIEYGEDYYGNRYFTADGEQVVHHTPVIEVNDTEYNEAINTPDYGLSTLSVEVEQVFAARGIGTKGNCGECTSVLIGGKSDPNGDKGGYKPVATVTEKNGKYSIAVSLRLGGQADSNAHWTDGYAWNPADGTCNNGFRIGIASDVQEWEGVPTRLVINGTMQTGKHGMRAYSAAKSYQEIIAYNMNATKGDDNKFKNTWYKYQNSSSTVSDQTWKKTYTNISTSLTSGYLVISLMHDGHWVYHNYHDADKDTISGYHWSGTADNSAYIIAKSAEITFHKHKYEWKQDVAPTCTAKGSGHNECACGAKKDVGTEIKELGHLWPDSYTFTNNNGVTNGLATRNCQRCGCLLEALYLQSIYYRFQNADGSWPSTYTKFKSEWYGYGAAYPACTVYAGSVTHKAASVSAYTVASANNHIFNIARQSYTISTTPGTGISSCEGAGSYLYGQTATVKANCKPGYHFINWTWTGGSAVTNPFSFGVSGSVALKANGQANNYTVRLQKNKPSDATNEVQATNTTGWTNGTNYYSAVFTYDSTTLPNTSFYSLVGWHTKDNNWYRTVGTNGTASGTAHAGGSNNLTTTKDATVDVYPYWEKNKYYIKYDGNNTATNIYGYKATTNYAGSTADTTCYYDSNVTIANNTFTKKGYKFKEWNTRSDGKGTSYSQGQVLVKPNFTATNGGSITLYAIWEPIKYKVRFNGNYNWNTEQGSYTREFQYDKTDDNRTSLFTRNNNTFFGGIAGSVTAYTYKKGYSQTGWASAKNHKEPDYLFNQTTAYNLTATENAIVDIYAVWKKGVSLKFVTNTDSVPDKTLEAYIYNDRFSYTFDIVNGSTLPTENQDKQINIIDAYGTVEDNGLNSLYTKRESNGYLYRFLGWSLNPTATEPDAQFDVYSASKVSTYNIKDDTILYAVWEPVLQVNASLERTLGVLKFTNGTTPVQKANNLTSNKPKQKLGVILRPGEQGQYSLETLGRNDRRIAVQFDTRITDIYTKGDENSIWKDNLNPIMTNNEGELLKPDQVHSLDRLITNVIQIEKRKFYIPQYLGTTQSYDTSNPDKVTNTTTYNFGVIVSQDSYYYKKCFGTTEDVELNCVLYLSTDPTAKEPSSILEDLRTQLKIRLK